MTVPEATAAITFSTGLPHPALGPVRDLLSRCNAHDSTAFLMSLKPEADDDNTLPRYVIARDNEQIAGVAELIGYREVEGTILVDPRHRHHGIGRSMVAAAARELAERGIARWLLVCDEAFPGGVIFAQTFGAERAYFEHRLTLDPALVPPLSEQGKALGFRQAVAADAADLAAITAAAFGDPPDEVGAWIAPDLTRTDRRWFLGTIADHAVGSLRIVAADGGADITAFGVLPTEQGRGYGRALLSRTIALLRAEGEAEINIEVETDNAAALGLYRSCGFVPQHTYGYYRVATALTQQHG